MNPTKLRSYLLFFAALLFGLASGHAAELTLSNLTQTYNGEPREVTVETNPPGVSVIVDYDGNAAPPTTPAPTNAGTYSVIAFAVPPESGTASGTLTIEKAQASINITGLIQKFDGAVKPVSAGLATSSISFSRPPALDSISAHCSAVR